ncbi:MULTISPECIES: hypothetical protein [Mycolicibacterium]|uniref:Uncharacterized protein n=1 Tax=Mycolicibacterium farcinogenes TaxID=1802 RepID=A0ACD1FF28_MYCFR|nr:MULTISPECIES: hypothetical protein [Mycolicibacterium]MCW1820227.1 hypothetical protein [Mycolicibacterium senegalense]QZH65628.1 hypothetical protein K6L26_27295 [Mycolicibacterium farcinogenes]
MSTTHAKGEMEKFARRSGIAVTLIFIAMLAPWAVNAAKQLSFVTLIVILGLVWACVYLIFMMTQSKTVAFQASFDATGTQLRPDKRIENNLRRFIVTAGLSTWLMFLAWVVGVLYLPFDVGRHVFPLCAGAAAAVLTWCWVKLRRQGSLSYLSLTPDGFEFSTLREPKTGKWDEIENIADRLPDEERFWNPMVVTLAGGETLLMEAPGTYTPKGTALVQWVRLYWQHPELRDELTDGRAVARLRAA